MQIVAKSMREGKSLVLATKEFAFENRLRSWWCIITTAVLLLLALSGTIAPFNWAVKISCSFLGGLLMVRAFVIYHDHQHRSILPDSRLAKVLMKLYGLYCLSPNKVWKESHDFHHKHNSKLRSAFIGSFPIMTKDNFRRASKSQRLQYLYMRHTLTILCGYFTDFWFGLCLAAFFHDARKNYEGLIAAVWHVSLGVMLVVWFGWSSLLLTLLVPHFICGAVGSYLFYAQHNFPDVTFVEQGAWTYEGAALESSSFMTMSGLMHWFTANIGYHHIHHLNAKIPFYRLPEAMEKIPELQHPKTTSLSLIETLRCLRLKVLDVEANQMIGLNQI